MRHTTPSTRPRSGRPFVAVRVRAAFMAICAIATAGVASNHSLGAAELASVGGRDGGIAGDLPPACGEVSFTQSNAFQNVQGIGCLDFNANATFANSWARAFAVAPDAAFAVDCVDVGVLNFGDSFTITVNLLTGTITDPYETLIHLAAVDVLVPENFGSDFVRAEFANVDGAIVPAGATLIIEVFAPTRHPSQGGDNGVFFVGTNGLGQTGPSYHRSSQCSSSNFLDLATIGFPNFHLVMRVGGGAVSCVEDLTGDGQVAGDDLGILLSEWGDVSREGSASDLNDDGTVDGEDLGALLAAWGSC